MIVVIVDDDELDADVRGGGEKDIGVAESAAGMPLPRTCLGTTIVGTMTGVFLRRDTGEKDARPLSVPVVALEDE
jgi:hypothetical protein